jgi:hypothetical protein
MSNPEPTPTPTHLQLRLLAAAVAIIAGIAATVIALLFLKGALG